MVETWSEVGEFDDIVVKNPILQKACFQKKSQKRGLKNKNCLCFFRRR